MFTVDSETQFNEGSPMEQGLRFRLLQPGQGESTGCERLQTVLIKNAHRNRTTFTLRFTVNVNEIFFPQKLRHSEIKSSRLRDRKKPPITAQSCRISKIYRDLDNAFRLFSAYENKRGMGEGPHPVDYRLGGAILLLILD